MADLKFDVVSPDVEYTEQYINSEYTYHTTLVDDSQGVLRVVPKSSKFKFQVARKVPRVGVMLVGWGGNNGSTFTAGIIANREKISWRTKSGVKEPNYFGSLTQASTTRLGSTAEGKDYYVAFKDLLPMVNPNDLVIGGWDINGADIAEAMERAEVLEYDLQRQLVPYLREQVPLASIYYPDFIAANQSERANNIHPGSNACSEHLDQIRKDIRDFKQNNELDKVIILWTANTERFSDIIPGVNDTEKNLLDSIKSGHAEVSPSTMFAVASILEGCSYINGSPQNTFVPGVIELANRLGVFIGGDDFKSGQTKMKSVIVDFLVSAGIKVQSIVSYNHLGNNDGKNLSAPQQFRSKEISKSNVVDDMVASNSILYAENEHPDHVVVIKYVPYVKDSKRALDEYVSEIFMGGQNTISMHNTCEDSLLATPLMIDLIIIAEIMERVSYMTEGMMSYEKFNSVLSVLSYLLKAPMVPAGTPVVNALFKQRACIENIFRACVGLYPESNMFLEHKTKFHMSKML